MSKTGHSFSVLVVLGTAAVFLASDGRGAAPGKFPTAGASLAAASDHLPGANPRSADERSRIYDLGVELERQATSLAEESFNHFRGWNGTISDQEQRILFKSEEFASSARLFLKLAETRSDFFRGDYLRTNLFRAFTYLSESYGELEQEMKRGGVQPFSLSECRNLLVRMEREFASWPDADNLAYLDQKYVKARDASVYLIERRGIGNYVRRPFQNLESLFRYNYDRKRGKDPWAYLVEIPEASLDRMRLGPAVSLTFEGAMVIEQSERKNRGVYLIRDGKKHGLTRPELVNRFGGWGKVYEVPREVLDSYEDGDPIE